MRFTRMKVPGVNERKLTVLGHLCIKKPCSEELLKILFTRKNVNLLEEFNDHSIPLLHLAVFYGNHAAVSVLCSCEGINLCVTNGANPNASQIAFAPEVQELQWLGDEILRTAFRFQLPTSNFNENDEFTALHCAAWQGHSIIVATLAQKISSDLRARTILNALDKYGISALHYAVMRGDAAMVEDLLSYSMVRGYNGQERGKRTPVEMACLLCTEEHLKGLDINKVQIVREYKAIIDLLSKHPDVQTYTEILQKRRQRLVDSANATLVVAALITSITYSGFLQPPLGYTPDYNTRYLVKGYAAPPVDTYHSCAEVGIAAVQLFWIFNGGSFYLAIASMLIAICILLPGRGRLKSRFEAHVHDAILDFGSSGKFHILDNFSIFSSGVGRSPAR